MVDDYDVGGTKMGVIIKPTLTDTPLYGSPLVIDFHIDDIGQYGFAVFSIPDTIEHLHINNVGNVPIEYQLNVWIREAYLDSKVFSLKESILPDSYIDLDFANDYFPPYPSQVAGFYIRVDFGPTPYIIGIANHSFLEGNFQFVLDFRFNLID